MIVVRVIVGLLAILLMAFLAAEWMRRQSLFFPFRYPVGDWDRTDLAIEPESIFFEASDGTRLHGWYFSSGKSGAPLIVFFHGNGGNITHRIEPSVNLALNGLDVFIFDYRGYGRSEGRPTEMGLYDDALAAWDLMRARHDGPIIVYGESLGGPYAAYVAAERKTCAAIIDSSFPSIRSVARAVYWPIPLHWLLRPGLETANHLDRASVPVLVLHSISDNVIPFALGRALYDAIDGPKEFYESKNALHSAIPWSDGRRYYEAVRTFVDTHCEADE